MKEPWPTSEAVQWYVAIHNDKEHSFQHIVKLLVSAFGIQYKAAHTLAQAIQNRGLLAISVSSEEEAKALSDNLIAAESQMQTIPSPRRLKVTIENLIHAGAKIDKDLLFKARSQKIILKFDFLPTPVETTSLRRLTQVFCVISMVEAGLIILSIVIYYWIRWLDSSYDSETTDFSELTQALDAMQNLSPWITTLGWIRACLLPVWMDCASRNVWKHRSVPTISGILVFVGWAIPGVNIFLPYILMNEIINDGHFVREVYFPKLIKCWWIFGGTWILMSTLLQMCESSKVPLLFPIVWRMVYFLRSPWTKFIYLVYILLTIPIVQRVYQVQTAWARFPGTEQPPNAPAA